MRRCIDERRKLERELTDAKKKLAMGGGAKAGGEANGVQTVGDIKLMARAVSGIDIKDLKSLADEGKKQLGSGVVALVGVTDEGKAGIVVGVTNDLTARFNAVDLVKKGAEALGGKGGGGRPDMAQAGGPDGAKAGCGARRDRGGARRADRKWEPVFGQDHARCRVSVGRFTTRRVPKSCWRSRTARSAICRSIRRRAC